MLALYVVGALLGWCGGDLIYSLLPSAFKRDHPVWCGGLVGGIVGLAIPPVLSSVYSLLTK
jgi:hypothetical protein